jgi:hypothetical protein
MRVWVRCHVHKFEDAIKNKIIPIRLSTAKKFSRGSGQPPVIIIMGVAGCMTLTFSWIRPAAKKAISLIEAGNRSLRLPKDQALGY